jgi:sugar fermentation stimulation protein A
MRYPPLLSARFVRRDNRFRVSAELDGEVVPAHLANPGRARELLLSDAPLFLVERPAGRRVTRFDVALVQAGDRLISADARLPNALFAEAIAQHTLAGFAGYSVLRGEVRQGRSRLDFVLQKDGDQGPLCWVEVKSVTLVEDSVGLFPDAPTLRGARHLAELTELATRGEQTAVVFVIQRSDVTSLEPNYATDPSFANALHQAASAGVSVYAYRCSVSLQEIRIADAVPVKLRGERSA